MDYETAVSHTLTVIVKDDGTPQLSTTVVVNIIVQNVNDGPPVFGGPYSATVSEDVSIGTSVADVVATDPDGSNDYGHPEYSIISGDPNRQFNIDSSTGRVTTRASLNAEAVLTYTIQVKAVERGGTNSATATLTVSVTDVNDVKPSCNLDTFAETVNEDKSVGYAILTLTCTDGDVTSTTLTYAISVGDTTKFRMTTNVLELKAGLDYDSGTTQYAITISVSDGVNTRLVVGSVSVGPINDNAPVFNPSKLILIEMFVFEERIAIPQLRVCSLLIKLI